jgi:hypothetical protein
MSVDLNNEYQARHEDEKKVANYVPEPAETRSVMEILAELSKSNPVAYEEAIDKLIAEKGHDWFKNLRFDWSINGRPKQFPTHPGWKFARRKTLRVIWLAVSGF